MEDVPFDFWKFLAGIGLFLLGMNMLETAIKNLGGRSFKNFIQRFTNSSWKGILVGASITAILQSSSLVTLMILAFLGAGVLTLKSAIGVILGANLGTTVTAWIVASLGFKLSVESFSLPFLGIGSLLYIFSKKRPILQNIGLFSVGFGLLFLGLDFMKTSIEDLAETIDIGNFLSYGRWIFLLLGIVITAMIQSSSAMIVIILSTMNAGLIGITEGAVMIIGAKIGTTVTVGIGSLGGSADKKRLALAHFLFNVVTGLILFFFVDQLIALTSNVFSIKDPLIELVLLNTLFTAIGILLFYPWLPKLEKWLSKRFKSAEPSGRTKYIKNVDPEVPDVAIDALEKEIEEVFEMVGRFIRSVWKEGESSEENVTIWRRILYQPFDVLSAYSQIKELEDEITKYHIALQEENLDDEDAVRLISLMLALRAMIYSAKDLKDVQHNIIDIGQEDEPKVLEIFENIRDYNLKQLEQMEQFLSEFSENDEIPNWIHENEIQYKNWIRELYAWLKENRMEYPVSTLTNVYKQVISSLDNLGNAVVHWKFKRKEVIDS